MEVVDCLAVVYNFEYEEVEWRALVERALRECEAAHRRSELLRAHVQTAERLRRAIRAEARAATPCGEAANVREALRRILEAVAHGAADDRAVPLDHAEIWEGIYSGTWVIVDHYERSGRRYLYVHETDAGEVDPLRLTPLQRGALGCLSRGLGDAEIAAELGVKPEAASALVRVIKKKLRMPVRRDLIGLNARCLRTRPLSGAGLSGALLYSCTELAQVLPESISEAERSILHLQIAGKTNNEIARIRRVAYKTISNQVAAAYSKLNVRTCGEMVHILRAACR